MELRILVDARHEDFVDAITVDRMHAAMAQMVGESENLILLIVPQPSIEQSNHLKIEESVGILLVLTWWNGGASPSGAVRIKDAFTSATRL